MSWIAQHVLPLIEQYGPIALFVSLTIETLGLPAPGETALISASAAAGRGAMSIWHVVIAAWLGAVLGDNIGYFIGRRYGSPVVLAYGGKVGITHERYARVEEIMARYGPIVVLLARFVVLLRQLNGLVAGTTEMPWLTFLVVNVIGAALWVGFWSYLAYRVGSSTDLFPFLWQNVKVITIAVVPVAIVALLFLYLRQRRRASR